MTIRGKWIALPDGKILNDGFIEIHHGVIQKVTKLSPGGEVDEHDGLVIPGLINSHTHLEFSDLEQPLGEPGTGFVEWVGQVMNHRRTREATAASGAILRGLKESERNGVCAIGEISTFDWSESEHGVQHVTKFRELIGFRLEQADEIQEIASQHVGDSSSDFRTQNGLSPHAPYSINRESLGDAIKLSSEHQVPLAMHLAETMEELELLANHTGPFFELLNRLGLWHHDNFPLRSSPLDFLQRLSKAFRALVVHGNYLSRHELQWIGDHRDVLKLVYCPRTHEFFGHERYPLKTVMELKIPLALGTDSRASNPDLSIWNEMNFVHENNQQIDPFEILKMGTVHGAQALGIERNFGTIEPGKKPAFYLCPPEADNDFVKALVEGR